MRWVRMPWVVIVAVVVCLFLVGLYGLRQYGVMGRWEYAVMAVAAAAACLALVAGMIYANYEAFSDRTGLDRKSGQVNGTCR